MNNKTRWITMTALGIALFVVLALCIQVPIFENYYLCLGYVALVVYAGHFGSVSGALVGFLGVILYCLLTSGLRGMPGWSAGNLLIGLVLGWGFRQLKKYRMTFRWFLCMGGLILAVTAAAMLGVKSLVEHLLYAQPMTVRMAKNIYAFVADTVVMWIALPIYGFLEKQWSKILPEEKI